MHARPCSARVTGQSADGLLSCDFDALREGTRNSPRSIYKRIPGLQCTEAGEVTIGAE